MYMPSFVSGSRCLKGSSVSSSSFVYPLCRAQGLSKSGFARKVLDSILVAQQQPV